MPIIEKLAGVEPDTPPKREKPSLAQFKQTHEPFAPKSALPEIGGATGLTEASAAFGGSSEVVPFAPAKPLKKTRPSLRPHGGAPGGAKRASKQDREIDDMLQEFGID